MIETLATIKTGELYALGAALGWAVAVVFYKKLGEKIPAFELNLFKNSVGLLLFTCTIAGMSSLSHTALTWNEIALLSFSGILGITFADTLIFYSLNHLGAGASAIINCLYSPFAILFAVLMLNEKLSPTHLIGTLLIVCAVLLVGLKKDASETVKINRVKGILAGVVAMASMTFAMVLIKPLLEKSSLLWVIEIRLGAAVAAAVLYTLITGKGRATIQRYTQADVSRFALLAGSILGAYISMALFVASYQTGRASVVAVIHQTATIWIVLLATYFLGETLTRNKLIATILGISGAILITIYG